MPNKGYDDTIGGWEELLEAVRSHAGDLPGADSLRAALELCLEEAKAAKSRQELHSAGRLRATRDLGQSMAAGRETVIRLHSLVKSAYGPRDERLRKFGVAPIKLKRGPRKSKKQQQTSAGSNPTEATT